MKNHRVLFIGLGSLGSQIFDELVRVPGHHHFLVGGRNIEVLRERVNLSMLAAIQLGYAPQIDLTHLDLHNIEQTASIIARFRPDLIFCAATLQSSGLISHFPPHLAQQLAVAPMAPRLPLHLVLVYKLMQAVRLAEALRTTRVLNAVFPDMVHPILEKVGLAPTTGIGDLANNIPALRLSIARKLAVPLEQVDVRIVMAHWVSYWMSRRNVATAPFHFTALVNGEDCTHLLDHETLFDLLPTQLRRVGGKTGLRMTAASATVVFEAMMRDLEHITHVPGPKGLPGGYPVRVNGKGVELLLPPTLPLEAAIQINEAGLRFDGIECITPEGTVLFTEEAIVAYRETLGYECTSLPLAEVEHWAKELQEKYRRKTLRSL